MAPGCAGFCAGHMNLQCGLAPGCALAVWLVATVGSPLAHTIQSPLRDRGTTNNKVASLRSMTVAETMNKPATSCQGLFRGLFHV